MQTRARCFFVLILSFGSTTLMAVEPPTLKVERPILKLECPQPGQKLTIHDPLVIRGTVTPPVCGINVRILKPFNDQYEWGCNTVISSDTDGRFRVRLFPPEQGWPQGDLLLESELEGMRQIRLRSNVSVLRKIGADDHHVACNAPGDFDAPDPAEQADEMALIARIENDKYATVSNLIVQGSISSLESGYVEIRLQHLSPNGTPTGLGGATVAVGKRGQFLFDSHCWLGTWPVGTVRATVWNRQVPGVIRTTSFQVVGQGNRAKQPALSELRESSDVFIDADDHNRLVHVVPVGKAFLVRGTIPQRADEQESRIAGPSVSVAVQGRNQVIVGGGSAISLRDSNDRFWYEVEAQKVPSPGDYKLQLRCRATVLRELELKVIAPKPKHEL